MALCDSDSRFLAMWHFLFRYIKCSYEGYFDPQNSQDGSFETIYKLRPARWHCMFSMVFKLHVLISFLYQVLFPQNDRDTRPLFNRLIVA